MTTKYILRKAMRGRLPKEILARRKMGFPVPIGAWLRGPFSHVLDEYVLNSRAIERGIFNPVFVRELVARHKAGENHSERLWTLINFEIWQRRFFDCDPVNSESPCELESAPGHANGEPMMASLPGSRSRIARSPIVKERRPQTDARTIV